MSTTDYTYNFDCKKSSAQMYASILDVKQWWMGLFGESIKGKSKTLHDVFTFDAGDGLHYSKQELIEQLPHKRIVWLVTESKLTFLKRPDEWTGSTIEFDITETGAQSCHIQFRHVGLHQAIECYEACSSAWQQYLHNFEKASQ